MAIISAKSSGVNSPRTSLAPVALTISTMGTGGCGMDLPIVCPCIGGPSSDMDWVKDPVHVTDAHPPDRGLQNFSW